MKKPKQQKISQILIGDTLGELADKLDEQDTSKLINIQIKKPDGIRLITSEGISKVELIGSLHLAIDTIFSEDY